MEIPVKLRYTKEHEWASLENSVVTVGITDYAQSELGEIVFVELPEVGETCLLGNTFGVIEAVKTVADLYAPVTGEIIEVNSKLSDHPELVNKSAYGEGWMIKIKVENNKEWDALMSADEYKVMIES